MLEKQVKPLPRYLIEILQRLDSSHGESIEFIISNYAKNTVRGYISKLKSLGLVYTHGSGRDLEVWLTDRGKKYLV